MQRFYNYFLASQLSSDTTLVNDTSEYRIFAMCWKPVDDLVLFLLVLTYQLGCYFSKSNFHMFYDWAFYSWQYGCISHCRRHHRCQWFLVDDFLVFVIGLRTFSFEFPRRSVFWRFCLLHLLRMNFLISNHTTASYLYYDKLNH